MTEQVDQLAAIIRHVDGGNRLGAAALAEAILSHPDIGLVLANSDGPAVPESREPASVADHPSDEGEVSTIVDRLKELAHAVTAERWHEFSMRVPAEPLRDADLVISRSAELIQQQEAEINRLRAQQTPGEREAAAVEALQRLRQWGRLSGGGYSADVVLAVVDWIDGGMEGPLPPLPAHALSAHKKS